MVYASESICACMCVCLCVCLPFAIEYVFVRFDVHGLPFAAETLQAASRGLAEGEL